MSSEKLSNDERKEQLETMKNEMDVFVIGGTKASQEIWNNFNAQAKKLESQSPHKFMDTVMLMHEVTIRSAAIWEALRRDITDVEKQRGIKPEWITEKHMAIEGHITLLFKRPTDSNVRLFREGDGDSKYLTFSDGKFSHFEAPGLQKDGSIFVAYSGDQHRELRKNITMFRRTSIEPDDNDDEPGEETLVPNPPVTDHVLQD